MKKAIQIRVEPSDWDSWTQHAKDSGLSVSEWMRRKCNGQSIAISKPIPQIPSSEASAPDSAEYPPSQQHTTSRKNPLPSLEDSAPHSSAISSPAQVSIHLPKTKIRKMRHASSSENDVSRKTGHKMHCVCDICERLRGILQKPSPTFAAKEKRSKK